MGIPIYGWTKSLRIANLRADPSGIQSVGTTVQALLLPGMSTVTRNLRYLSLFTGAQYWRHIAIEQGHKTIKYLDFLRRFEAIIALSSVLHHENPNEIPSYIVGREFANKEVLSSNLRLDTGLINPPYNIYRGTLGELELFDLSKPDDPLHEGAKKIGQSWNIKAAGKIGEHIKQGTLPEILRRRDLTLVASTFCLCRVPNRSNEQHHMVNLLFGLGEKSANPVFSFNTWNNNSARVASWRLLLDIIDLSPGLRLDNHYLMARLLGNDLLEVSFKQSLKKILLLWRWVAARSLFELGWTHAFIKAFEIIKSYRDGLSTSELQNMVREKYINDHGGGTLSQLAQQEEANRGMGLWITENFNIAAPINCILLMICGAVISGIDISQYDFEALHEVDSWADIPFNLERDRLRKGLDNNLLAADYWADITTQSLVQHTYIASRKMSQGNPDTQHVDFEDNRWVLPPKRDGWGPLPSTGFSRFDIGLGWLYQLGLVIVDDQGSYTLTDYGKEVRDRWDKAYRSWA